MSRLVNADELREPNGHDHNGVAAAWAASSGTPRSPRRHQPRAVPNRTSAGQLLSRATSSGRLRELGASGEPTVVVRRKLPFVPEIGLAKHTRNEIKPAPDGPKFTGVSNSEAPNSAVWGKAQLLFLRAVTRELGQQRLCLVGGTQNLAKCYLSSWLCQAILVDEKCEFHGS